MLIKKILSLFAFAFLLLPIYTSTAQAMSCTEVAPEYTNFAEKDETKCIEKYDTCLSKPDTYTSNTCSKDCDSQYPGRINSLSDEGCLELGPDYYNGIIKAYEKSYSLKSATKLADYCQCLRECRDQYKEVKDCETPLVNCCQSAGEKISSTNNPTNQNPFDSSVDDSVEEQSFTISKIIGDDVVYIFRKAQSDDNLDDAEIAQVGTKIYAGDSVSTGYKTKAFLENKNGRLILEGLTNIDIRESTLTIDGITDASIGLAKGKVTSKFQPIRGLRAKWSIKPPVFTVGVRGTIFSVSYDDTTGDIEAQAYEHDIYVYSEITGQTTDVSEGDYAQIDGATVTTKPMTPDQALPSEYLQFLNSSSTPVETALHDTNDVDFNAGSSFIALMIGIVCLTLFIIILIITIILLFTKKNKIATILGIIDIVLLIGAIISFVYFGYQIFGGGDTNNNTPNNYDTYTDFDDYQDGSTTNDYDNTATNSDNQDDQLFSDNDYTPDSTVMGFFENDDYDFSFFADQYAPELVEIKTTPDWAVASYDYCLPIVDTNYESLACSAGQYNTHNIVALSQSQYQTEVVDSPLGDTYTLLGEKDGLYFVFSHPNGDIPAELGISDDWYSELIFSFTFL